MQKVTEIALVKARRAVFTRREAAFWVDSRGARLDALLKRAVGAGEVWRIRRGLYCLSNRYTIRPINPLEIAQQVHGPSYVSLETALSYHGWIPEAVHAITSASLERARTFDTPIGFFTYTRIPQRSFFTEVIRVEAEEGKSFFLAKPLKALTDYVYAHRCEWNSIDPVLESLRVDEELLTTLDSNSFDAVSSAYSQGRVQRFLTGLREDLQL